MNRLQTRWRCAVAALFLAFFGPMASADPPRAAVRAEGFVETNGVRLQYLDWGGTGPALILIHGLGDNPYVFDDVAPAFTDRFHVIAYARRGCGSSDVKGPYDVVTMTNDLRGLMDALGIYKADLVGYSAGGGEITEMAAEYPQRVGRLVYFDGAYDWADPDFQTAVKALPSGFFDPPSSAMASLDAFRSYLKVMLYPGLDDIARVDSNLRAKVVIRPDGSLKYKISKGVVEEFYSALWTNKRSDYARVRAPALAIYAAHLYDLHTDDAQRREKLDAYERKYWIPYQMKSMNQVRHELSNVEIIQVPGTHSSFFMTDHQEVVETMRRFLVEPGTVAQNQRR